MSVRVGSPWWLHVGLGVLVAQQVLVGGLGGGNWTLLSFAVLVAGAAVLVALARRSTGVTVAGPRGPRSRLLMAARFVAALACIWGAGLIGGEGIAVLVAIVALPLTALLGAAYDAALRLDIAEGHPAA
ncbi:hypothetical protein HCJ93_23145 [Streptomyces sp. SBST2-5]|uniref:Integral membrane protein n=1 Tax=Streptomyces composti TaxID=2720025 RepID=A0ABX1AD91_9ACTN|nr:hypothetical protein [Streptomyces composti]NJP52882.1 hypothetical protein [Streptomyces composti]